MLVGIGILICLHTPELFAQHQKCTCTISSRSSDCICCTSCCTSGRSSCCTSDCTSCCTSGRGIAWLILLAGRVACSLAGAGLRGDFGVPILDAWLRGDRASAELGECDPTAMGAGQAEETGETIDATLWSSVVGMGLCHLGNAHSHTTTRQSRERTFMPNPVCNQILVRFDLFHTGLKPSPGPRSRLGSILITKLHSVFWHVVSSTYHQRLGSPR